MFPESFIQRITKQQYIDVKELSQALLAPSATSVRVNNAKWKQQPLNCEAVPWCSDGYYLENRPSYTLDPLYHSGCYYPQEASGMFLEQVFRQTVENNNYIKALDLCGAPGGKSTHLSTLIGSGGLLVANEVIRTRASILAENLTKWGASNCVVTHNDPSAFSRLQGFFDLILVDAPCSGEGMFRDSVAVNEWSENNTTLCSERQKRILLDAWPSLKTGGILIYSTCTFNPGENEENIKWLTANREAESVRLDVSEYQGITEIDFQGVRGYGFYPGKIRGEGLFISVLRKTGDQGRDRIRIKQDTASRLTKEDEKITFSWIQGESKLLKAGNEIISIPCSYQDFCLLSEYVRIVKPGTKMGTIMNKKFLPDHELAMSVSFRKGICPSAEVDYDQAIAYLSRESLKLVNIPKGWINVRYNDVSLGFINNLGNRQNNYYPIGWRIRMDRRKASEDKIIGWVAVH